MQVAAGIGLTTAVAWGAVSTFIWVVPPNHFGVIRRFGSTRVYGPGRHVFIPCLDWAIVPKWTYL